jgi:hypothetical protein
MKNKSKVISIFLLAIPLFLSQCKKLTEDPVCVFPSTVTVNNITNVAADASWSEAEDAQQYLFEYRKVGTTSYTVVRVTSGTSTKIINLASATTYEYRVQTNCPSSNSSYSALTQFTTLSNNQFNITKKWRMKFFKENNVQVALGPNDYMDFAEGGGLSQSLTIGSSAVISNGSWSFFSNNDSLTISLNSAKKWRIKSLDANNFLMIKNATAPLTTVDSLRFEAFQ